MEVQAMNSKQRAQWNKFVNDLRELNRLHLIVKGRLVSITSAIDIYKKQTEALPPSYNIGPLMRIKSYVGKMEGIVRSLNYSYSLIQSTNAGVAPSIKYPGDLDIVTIANLPGGISPGEIQAATYNRAMLPRADSLGVAPILPLIIKGALALGGAAIVYGIVNAVTETIVKEKKLDVELIRAQGLIESDMKDDPQIFKLWTDYKKKTLAPAKRGIMDSIGAAGVGIAGLAIAGVVGFVLIKALASKQNA